MMIVGVVCVSKKIKNWKKWIEQALSKYQIISDISQTDLSKNNKSNKRKSNKANLYTILSKPHSRINGKFYFWDQWSKIKDPCFVPCFILTNTGILIKEETKNKVSWKKNILGNIENKEVNKVVVIGLNYKISL